MFQQFLSNQTVTDFSDLVKAGSTMKYIAEIDIRAS